jgi:hypothetical protein
MADYRPPTNMFLAGIPVPDRLVLELARRLRDAALRDTAERLEGAYDREARIVALEVSDREALLRVLEDAPAGLDQLRGVLLQDAVWMRREGLA